MKKLALLLVFMISASGFAQRPDQRKEDFKNLTPVQQATLQTKQMALDLVLNDAQQKSLMTLNQKQAEQRKAHMDKMAKLSIYFLRTFIKIMNILTIIKKYSINSN